MLFQEDWWYEAATAGQWTKVEVQRDGVMVASMPVFVRKRHGLRSITMPLYTRTLEPFVDAGEGKEVARLSHRISTLGELLGRLPRHDRFEITLARGSGLALGFVANGYLVSRDFTFIFDGGSDIDALWRDMDQKTRNLVKTYSKRCRVEQHDDIERFLRMSTLERGGAATNQNDFDAITRIVEACRIRNQVRVLSCLDESGADVAVAVLVWDRETLYYWLSARDPERSRGGANSLLLWEAIRAAHSRGLTFDSDGFAGPSAIRFLGNFGLRPVERPIVNGANRRWRIVFLAKMALRPRSHDLTYHG